MQDHAMLMMYMNWLQNSNQDIPTPFHLAGGTNYPVLVWSLAYPNYARPLPDQYDCMSPRNGYGWFSFNLAQISVSEHTSVTARIAVASNYGIGLLRFGTLSVILDDGIPRVDFHMDLAETDERMASLRADGALVLVLMKIEVFEAHFSDIKEASTPNRWEVACFPLLKKEDVAADQTRSSETGQLTALQHWVAPTDEPSVTAVPIAASSPAPMLPSGKKRKGRRIVTLPKVPKLDC